MRTDSTTLVMHALRLRGLADAGTVAELAGAAEADAQAQLDRLVSEGLATHRNGRISGFALTPQGRERHALLLREELDAAGARAAVEHAYATFLTLNPDLLMICTDWQLRSVDGQSVVNDHRDGVHDAEVIARLAALHATAEPICDELGDALERFQVYWPKLAAALARVQAGDTDWFTKPMIASYHTVWFELHEDLLCTLGIERGAEEAG